MHDVSIIIPVYCTTIEGLQWLKECIDSALLQDCEVVLYNDGSTVDVDPVVSKYADHILYKYGVHKGVSHARNQAAKLASKSLIYPLDCDDRLVPGAIAKLLTSWDGETPVYADVKKFGSEDVPHYALLDFACEHIYKHVGFSSVNVLHKKDQWKSIGGWDTTIDFYEDGEYNARLYAMYCGRRHGEPLVEYRIHPGQRTAQYKRRSAAYARAIMDKIRRLDMACKTCGGARKSITNAQPAPITTTRSVNIDSLPGELEGRILVRYMGGKGRGKHYYRGIVTKFPYKVLYGDYLYVDPKDARAADEHTNVSLFVRVEKTVPAPMPIAPMPVAPRPVVAIAPESVKAVVADTVVRSARKDVDEKVPAVSGDTMVELPDIHNMSVKEVYSMDAIPVDIAHKLLEIEAQGKNRSKVITFLKGFVNG